MFENNIIEGEGACIRVGGHEYDDTDFGKNNEVNTRKISNSSYLNTVTLTRKTQPYG